MKIRIGLVHYLASVFGGFAVAASAANAAESNDPGVVIPQGAEWRYTVEAQHEAAWTTLDFDGSAWASGRAQIGYGDGDEATVVTGEPRPMTIYLRHTFELPLSFAPPTPLVGRLLRDDGAVVYVNGHQVIRSNMPDGAIGPDTLASSTVGGEEERRFHAFELDSSVLSVGENVIAVEVHQVSSTSSDISFDFSLGSPDVHEPGLPIVSISAAVAETTEPSPLIRVIPGQFNLRRTGGVTEGLAVLVEYSGTAEPGADYHELPRTVAFPPGAEVVELLVGAIDDDLVEETEYVVAKLLWPEGDGLPTYEVDPEHREARVTIHDSDRVDEPHPGMVRIVEPAAGDSFPAGEVIRIEATAFHPESYVPVVEFFDGERSIGTSRIDFIQAPELGTVLRHTIEWEGASVGEHMLRAVGVSAHGVTMASEGVPIVVVHDDPLSHVFVDWIEPRDGSEFPPSSVITLEAGARSETGDILVVRFYDGEHLIGVDETSPYQVHWKAPSPGRHFLRAVAEDSSGMSGSSDRIHVTIGEPNDLVVIGIEAVDAIALEPGPDGASDVAIFLVRRLHGPLEKGIAVKLAIGGSALNGVDYEEIASTVELAPGARAAEIVIRPLQDEEMEGEESVVIELARQECADGSHDLCYGLGDRRSARAVIREQWESNDNHPPRVTILHPKNGATIAPGRPIEIVVEGTDAAGEAVHIAVFADEELLTDECVSKCVTLWESEPGHHILTARATDASGQTAVSEPVHILVKDIESFVFVHRELPEAFAAGDVIDVVLDAKPPAGTRGYTVYDQFPSGATFVSASHEGSLSAVGSSVGFGPFGDAEPRRLTYQLVLPDGEGGFEFHGISWANDASYPIGGDRIITLINETHPADLAPADNAIDVEELKAYARAWKDGAEWTAGPSPIPHSYVTRAAALWSRGETYFFTAEAKAPFSWQSAESPIHTLKGEAVRHAPEMGTPGEPMTVEIRLAPPEAAAVAVEECVPRDWVVTEISHDGVYDARNSCIRWGPFIEEVPAELSYAVRPPDRVATSGTFRGSASFNGVEQIIGGTERSAAIDAATAMHVEADGLVSNGEVRLRLRGAPDQICVIEVSNNLINWFLVEAIVIGPDGVTYAAPHDGERNFYRTRLP